MREDEIRRLIRILYEHEDLTEIEVASYPFGGMRIRIARHGAPAAVPAPARPAPAPFAEEEDDAPVAAAPVAGGHAIKAPMVGTFYEAPNPDAAPFVSVGSRVSPGTVLCIIEAMKLMNEIESDVAGTVRDISVANGQPVEFGQTLFLIEPD